MVPYGCRLAQAFQQTPAEHLFSLLSRPRNVAGIEGRRSSSSAMDAAGGAGLRSRSHHRRRHTEPALLPQVPFHLLEISIISAQDLHPATRSMHTYASAWVDRDQKLYTRLDTSGRRNPTWNDKFVFRIGDAFLKSETAAVTIHLHAARGCFSLGADHLLGIVRVVISALRPTERGSRVVALQVRRPTSLRPQGILNVGVGLVGAYMRSMPMYYDPNAPSAFAYKDVLGGRRTVSLPKITGNDAAAANYGQSSDQNKWQLERKQSAELGNTMGERERRALQSKLDRWKLEMTPERELANESAAAGVVQRKKKSAWNSCFCGGSVTE